MKAGPKLHPNELGCIQNVRPSLACHLLVFTTCSLFIRSSVMDYCPSNRKWVGEVGVARTELGETITVFWQATQSSSTKTRRTRILWVDTPWTGHLV